MLLPRFVQECVTLLSRSSIHPLSTSANVSSQRFRPRLPSKASIFAFFSIISPSPPMSPSLLTTAVAEVAGLLRLSLVNSSLSTSSACDR